LTWHYRQVDRELGATMARRCRRELETEVARKYDVEIMTGKMNLEVRPRFLNKGEIAMRLMEECGVVQGAFASPSSPLPQAEHITADLEPLVNQDTIEKTVGNLGSIANFKSDNDNALQFILCLGDDSTDEDMFRSIQHSTIPVPFKFSVTVGPSSKQTLADWHVIEPSDVVDVIELLCSAEDCGVGKVDEGVRAAEL
jgi:trehalose 6-phosphate synthase/phosphatase